MLFSFHRETVDKNILWGEQMYHKVRIEYSNFTDLGTKIQRVHYLKSFIKSKHKADFLLRFFENSQSLSFLEQQSPTFLAAGTGFMEDNFSTDGGGGWFWDDSSTLHLLCTLLLLLLHCNI